MRHYFRTRAYDRVRRTLNPMFVRYAGGDSRPPLIEPRAVFPASQKIEESFDAIHDEIIRLTQKNRLVRYADVDLKRAEEVSLDWKLYYIKFLGKYNDRALVECPVITGLTRDIPAIRSVIIAALEPRVELAAHSGPYAGILRYHLGVKIPRVNPPSIRVADRIYTWREGESIVLDDFFEHEVYNKSDEIRIILMIDIYRPMNWLLTILNKLYLHGLSSRLARHFLEKF